MKRKTKKFIILSIGVLSLVFTGAVVYEISYIAWHFHMQRKPVPELHKAVQQGDIELVRRLLNEGEAVNEQVSLFGRAGIVTPLSVAAADGHCEIAEILISHGASLHKSSPLTYAAKYNSLDVAVLLLDKGANPNKHRTGNTPSPLLAAARNGHVKMVKLLIERGVDVLAKENEALFSPIHEAAGEGHNDVVELLISKGVKVNGPPSGRLPIHQAAVCGQPKTVELLLAHGADLDRKDAEGKTALDLAKEFQRKAVVDVLRKHGAEE